MEAALQLVMEDGSSITMETVKNLMGAASHAMPPQMDAFEVDLSGYDALLQMNREVAL